MQSNRFDSIPGLLYLATALEGTGEACIISAQDAEHPVAAKFQRRRLLVNFPDEARLETFKTAENTGYVTEEFLSPRIVGLQLELADVGQGFAERELRFEMPECA